MNNIEKNDLKNFSEKLEEFKKYILHILWLKKEKTINETKEKIENTLNNKSFFNKLKNIFWWDDKIWWNNKESKKLDKYESHNEDMDEYIPKDSEFWESIWEKSRFAEIYPWFKWYFTSWKKSYFDKNTNLWSKKKILSEYNLIPNKNEKSFTYAWTIINWTVSIPLPEWSLIDLETLNYSWKRNPFIKIDQNNCLYISSTEKQYISFKFYINQKLDINPPINEDNQKIIFSKLSDLSNNLLKNISWNNLDKANTIKNHIISTKKYSTSVQWTLRDKSNSDNYIANLDKSPILECFSANALFVWLCREIWISARLVVWHMIQNLDKDWKSLLSSNNWHAWSEIWNNDKWIRFDATPTQKEDWENSEQNMQESWNNENSESNMLNNWELDNNQTEWIADKNMQENQNKNSEWNSNPENNQNWKNPSEALDELIKKARDDNMAKQGEKIKETIEELKNVKNKEEIKDILNKSELTDFAKEEIDKIWNEEILNQEINEIKNIDSEKDLDKALENSLVDKNFREKLYEYAKELRKKIQEEKKKEKSEMERMWFNEDELKLYKEYKELEKELNSEIQRQIKALEKILPPIYRTTINESEYFKSGTKLGNTWKLIEHQLTWDPKVFRRNTEIKESNEINMFETIIIDKSWSMGNFSDKKSPIREALKASIIRAKVLEYFKVEFSIILFDDKSEEIMSFWEKFSDRKKNSIPSKLMRSLQKSWWTDIWIPLSLTLDTMKKYSRKTWKKSFWNISFLWDWEPTDWLIWDSLKSLIKEIKSQWFWLTAYYINWSSQNNSWLQKYFWNIDSGWTIIVKNVSELTDKLIGSYNENLKNIIRKYTKK